MYIRLAAFFIFFIIVMIVLIIILKITKITEKPTSSQINSSNSQVSSLLSIGSDPAVFNPPPVWVTDGNEFPLDPAIPNDRSCNAATNLNNVCVFYSFEPVNEFYPPNIKYTSLLDTNGCTSSTSTIECSALPNVGQTCLWPDQLFAMYGRQRCAQNATVNSGNKCTRQDGTFANAGEFDCFYSGCSTNGSAKIGACTSPLELIILTSDPQYFYKDETNLNHNPLQAMACLTLEYVHSSGSSTFSFNSGECSIKNLSFVANDQCTTLAPCKSQWWAVQNYTIAANGNLTPSPKGEFMSIYDRNTGLFLAPVGFNPISSTPLQFSYTQLQNKIDLTLVPDRSATPGVWWMNVPDVKGGLLCLLPDGTLPANEFQKATSSPLCSAPNQIIFTSGWKNAALHFTTPQSTQTFILNSGSIIFDKNLMNNTQIDPNYSGDPPKPIWPTGDPVNPLGNTPNGVVGGTPSKVFLSNYIVNYQYYQPSGCTNIWTTTSTATQCTTGRCCANNFEVGFLDYGMYNLTINNQQAPQN